MSLLSSLCGYVSLIVLLQIVATTPASAATATTNSGKVESMTDYPSLLYVATPFATCFGALLTPQTILTDAWCLYPFSNSSDIPDKVRGTLPPDYLMVGLPTDHLSSTMHDINLSLKPLTKQDQMGTRASVFMSMVGTYVDNSTFYGVADAKVHAYYPQSNYKPSSQQNFDVGVVKLVKPLKDAKTIKIQLDDLEAHQGGLKAIGFAPASKSKDPATQQVLYKGMDLDKVTVTDVDSLGRKECDKDYEDIFDLKDMTSFPGHPLPDKQSPIYCTQMYGNMTQCEQDTGIELGSHGAAIDSGAVGRTVLFTGSGSSIRVVSIGVANKYEVVKDNQGSCQSNGFVHYPRTGIYTKWIGWATDGTITSNGGWVNKPDSSSEYVFNPDGASALSSTLNIALVVVIAVLFNS